MRWGLGRIARGLVLLLIAGALFPARASAQTKLELRGGDRLRLSREDGCSRQVFWLRDLQDDSLIVSRKRDSAPFAIALGDLHCFKTLVPRSTGRGALHGAGIGLLLGGAAGAVVGAILGSGPGCAGQSASELCFNPGPVLTGSVLGVLGGVAGVVLGSVSGAIMPGKRWADVELPIQVDFKPGPGLPRSPRTNWNIGAGSFIVADDRWGPGFQGALSVRRSSSRYLESGLVLYCDLWRPAKEAPEWSRVTWETSGRAWLIGVAPTLRFSPAEPHKGTPRLFLEATVGVHGIVSDAEMLEYDAVYGHPPKVIKLMDAPIGGRADAGIGVSYPVGGFEPEIAIKLHGVVGNAETATTYMLELGVGF